MKAKAAQHGPPVCLLTRSDDLAAIADHIKRSIKNMPFDIRDYLEFDIPGSKADPDFGK